MIYGLMITPDLYTMQARISIQENRQIGSPVYQRLPGQDFSEASGFFDKYLIKNKIRKSTIFLSR